MTEFNNESSIKRSESYFKYLVFVLMLTQILDTYSTVFPGSIPSLIKAEFLGSYPVNEANAIIALVGGITSIGIYFLFFNQYLVDKVGRKLMLAITVIGMGIASLGMFLSNNYIMYTSFGFFLNFFFLSDIWLIYINEESKPNKRALNSNIILMVGLLGAITMVIFRFIFITETDPNWRGMTLFPIIIAFPLGLIILLTLKETSKYQLMKEQKLVESRSFIGDLKSIFKMENRKPYITILIMAFLFGFSNRFITSFEVYISDVGTIPQFLVSIIFLLTVFTVMIAYLINGLLADRIGRKPLIYLWSLLLPISVIMWVLGATNPQNAFTIVFPGYAISHISYWGLWGILRIVSMEQLPTDRRGTGVGFRSLIWGLGITIGAFLSSGVILLVGLGLSFIIFAFGNLIIIPLGYFFVKETKGVDLAEIK